MEGHSQFEQQMRSLEELKSDIRRWPNGHILHDFNIKSAIFSFCKEYEATGLHHLVAKHILDEDPDLVSDLFFCSRAPCLCADEDSFLKLTLLISLMEKTPHVRFEMDRIYMVAIRKFPDTAREFISFYSRPGAITFEEWQAHQTWFP